MNFYKHHIGDYAAATAHLTFTEDAAFSRLLRIYYRDERPLPVEVRAVQRLAGARSRDELSAIETILGEFFHLRDDGWHNKRADEEIARAQAQAETNRAIAEAREARRRGTNTERNVHESCNESSAVREPSQTPDSRLQKEQKQKPPSRPAPVFMSPPEWLNAEAWAEWCAYRKGKKWTDRAQALSIGKLFELQAEGQDPAAVIRQSIAAGWTGLFALKTNGASHEASRRLSAVDRVRASAVAGELADRAAHQSNGSADLVGSHGRDLRAPLDDELRGRRES